MSDQTQLRQNEQGIDAVHACELDSAEVQTGQNVGKARAEQRIEALDQLVADFSSPFRLRNFLRTARRPNSPMMLRG
jgi:hypothetical protein